MLDQKFDKELLSKIKLSNLLPRPRWQFILRNAVVWILSGLSVVLGGITVSLITYLWQANRPGVFYHLDKEWLAAVPIFWLLCLALLLAAVYYNLRHTKNGYRYSVLKILGWAVAGSLLFGLVLSLFNLGERFDDELGRRAPFYEQMNPHVRFWSAPEQGRLSGMVLSVTDKHCVVGSIDRQEWQVDFSQAKLNAEADVHIGRPLRAKGHQTGPLQFVADEIMPVKSGRQFFKNFGPPPPPPVNEMELFNLFDKYPELKASFIKDLLADKEAIKKLVDSDSNFLPSLSKLNIPAEVIDQLKATK